MGFGDQKAPTLRASRLPERVEGADPQGGRLAPPATHLWVPDLNSWNSSLSVERIKEVLESITFS